MAKIDTDKAPVTQVATAGGLPGKPGQSRKTIMDARNILTVTGLDPAYKYHWVLDDSTKATIPNRLERGWEIVVRDGVLAVGDVRTNDGHPVDSRVTLRKGDEVLVLMRIKKEWFEEDHRLYHEDIDKRESGMRRKKSQGEDAQGLYGDVQIN